MWQQEFETETNSTKEKIWDLWSDVTNWNKWNAAVEYSYINGNFQNGINGTFKLADGAESYFLFYKLIDCIPNKSFTKRIKLAFCIIDIGYKLCEENSKLKINHFIKIYGLLSFIHKKTIGICMTKKMPVTVKKLVELAEKN